jgi:hypothetical protein
VAVHLATAIRGLNSASQIAQRLGIALNLVESALAFLNAHGLIEKRGSEYHFKSGSMHISTDSGWVQFHHSNWRQKALADAQMKDPASIHFTNVLTVSAEDAALIREVINRGIEQVMKIARPSKPEAMTCLTVDYFQIT